MKSSRLRHSVALFAFAGAVALQISPGIAAGAADAGSQLSPGVVAGASGGGNKESKILTLTKECGTAKLSPGELDYCTVTASNFRPLRGAKIRYFGPGFFTPPTHLFLDSWVVIESEQGGGGTAFGHCLVRFVPEVLGACQFTGGSGSLKNFRADVTVTAVDNAIWHWNGAISSDD